MDNTHNRHKILLIDDEEMGAELVAQMVADDGDLDFASVSDPRAALAAARERRPTILLVDLRMPVIDGFEVIRLLRQDGPDPDVPIIMLSSEDDPVLKVKGFEIGANDYLVKWPNRRELIARIRYHSHAFLARRDRDAAFADLKLSQQQLLQKSQELETSQAALFQAQKMEALGNLTGGIAHDFNNVLQIINGSLSLIKMYCAGNERAAQKIDVALAGIARGSQLSSQLLAFARRQPLQPETVVVKKLVDDVSILLQHGLGETIRLELGPMDDLWNVTADPGKLENVLLNLVINAKDAMPDGGVVKMSARNVAPRQFRNDPNPFVVISVTDTGSGIPAEIRERVFEPFFTTKPKGKGTGLGLSMAYGFVKQSHGHITIDSVVGSGTTVSIYLRATHDTATHTVLREAPAKTDTKELVLVVEDEDGVRSSTIELLEALGFRTLSAADGESALALVDSNEDIDIVFTDVVMPGPVRSIDFVLRAQALRPGLSVLFTSGYVQSDVLEEWSGKSDINFLAKPYNIDDLAAKLKYLLAVQPTLPH